MVGKFSFQRNSVLVALIVAIGLIAASANVITASPAQAQTTSTRDISGGEGVVSVVSVAPGSSPATGTGSPPARSPGVWPYTCNFYLGVTLDSLAIGVIPNPGSTYHLVCVPRPGFEDRPRIDNLLYVYQPGAPLDPTQTDLLASAELLDDAIATLNPTNLPPAFSPEAQQITGIETWLWPDGPRESTSAWASAGGLTVTVESRYRDTEFTLSGANTGSVRCADAPEWTPGATSSNCTFTFQDIGEQTITGTNTFDLFWWDNAASPTPQPLGVITETFEETVDVVDLEAVITR